MIASLHGTVEALGTDRVVINVNGIGFQVFVPTSILSTLSSAGSEVQLYTHLHVREDNIALYGFSSPDELRLFETLITVSGIGPKLSLAMLSAMNVEQLLSAITSGNADLLTRIPGIGKKTASRLVLELREKIGTGWVSTPAARIAQENTDVLEALTALGYSVSEAIRAVAALPSSTKLTIEEKVKMALQYFGGK